MISVCTPTPGNHRNILLEGHDVAIIFACVKHRHSEQSNLDHAADMEPPVLQARHQQEPARQCERYIEDSPQSFLGPMGSHDSTSGVGLIADAPGMAMRQSTAKRLLISRMPTMHLTHYFLTFGTEKMTCRPWKGGSYRRSRDGFFIRGS